MRTHVSVASSSLTALIPPNVGVIACFRWSDGFVSFWRTDCLVVAIGVTAVPLDTFLTNKSSLKIESEYARKNGSQNASRSRWTLCWQRIPDYHWPEPPHQGHSWWATPGVWIYSLTATCMVEVNTMSTIQTFQLFSFVFRILPGMRVIHFEYTQQNENVSIRGNDDDDCCGT